MLRMPASALTFLNEMEPKVGLESGGGGNGPPSSVQVLQRAQALVLSKAHKAFKKDVKAGDLEPEDAVAFDFLRANLEYIKVITRIIANCSLESFLTIFRRVFFFIF